jgi:AcrR family transcriptional regulator
VAVLTKEARRQSLLESAKAVFSEKGYHLAKIEDIVERAGVARGTFYLYFENKRATFGEILDDLIRRLRVAILRVDPTGPIHAQVLKNVERAVAILLDDPHLARILLTHGAGADPEFEERLASFYDAIARMLEDALRLGQLMGIVRPCDARLAAYACLGATKEVFHRIAVIGELDPRSDFAEQLLSQSLYGLLIRDGAGSAAAGAERAATSAPSAEIPTADAARPAGAPTAPTAPAANVPAAPTASPASPADHASTAPAAGGAA